MNLKQLVGIEAASYITDGMIVGLGTGSTAYYFIEELGRRVRDEHLQITGVPTSFASKQQAIDCQIPVATIDEVPYVDVVVDGADEVSAEFHGIKGGGAALLFEKIVASNSKQVIWIVDESKLVEHLGNFPLPIEVIPYGEEQLLSYFESQEYHPTFRLDQDGEKLVTDCKHHIIDLHLEEIRAPHALADELDHLVGVVEHGLFLDMAHTIIVGAADGVKTIHVPSKTDTL